MRWLFRLERGESAVIGHAYHGCATPVREPRHGTTVCHAKDLPGRQCGVEYVYSLGCCHGKSCAIAFADRRQATDIASHHRVPLGLAVGIEQHQHAVSFADGDEWRGAAGLVYQGKGVEDGKKSLGIEVTLSPKDNT